MGKSILEIYNHISVQQYKTDMGFKALVEGVHDNMYVIPEYQRKYRWSKTQVEELAASLIRDLPIPPIYTYRNDKGQLEILDGQQRVMSLYFYYIGKFFKNKKRGVFDYQEIDVNTTGNFVQALEKKYDIVPTEFYMDIEEETYNISYEKLPIQLRRKVDYFSITVVEIKISNSEKKDEILHKIFANLNSGGEKLSHQELRNGIYPCAFNRAILFYRHSVYVTDAPHIQRRTSEKAFLWHGKGLPAGQSPKAPEKTGGETAGSAGKRRSRKIFTKENALYPVRAESGVSGGGALDMGTLVGY